MVIEKKRKRTEASLPAKPQPTAPITTSLLKVDESFPRGGGSVLTPYEYKEATNEAKRDALFEESVEASSKSFKSSKRRKSGAAELTTTVREGPRIEGLSFKVRALF